MAHQLRNVARLQEPKQLKIRAARSAPRLGNVELVVDRCAKGDNQRGGNQAIDDGQFCVRPRGLEALERARECRVGARNDNVNERKERRQRAKVKELGARAQCGCADQVAHLRDLGRI